MINAVKKVEGSSLLEYDGNEAELDGMSGGGLSVRR